MIKPNVKNDFRLRLRFRGVRGSIATPRMENLGYGGNTSCVEITLPGNEFFIFDAGTGIVELGSWLSNEFPNQKLSLTCFLTHFHWDHIQGIPFFSPLYHAETEMTFHSFSSWAGLEEMLEGQMKDPYFPVPFEFLPAKRNLIEIGRDPVKYGELTVHPFPLNHPQGALGYRIEFQGAVVVYATDHEHGRPEVDSGLREYAQGADVLIYDAQYTPQEYESHKGWGHSTWLEATRVAHDSKVKQLILFHHDPWRTDQMCDLLVAQARRHFDNTMGAKEGEIVML